MPDLHQGKSKKLCNRPCELSLKLNSNLFLQVVLSTKSANIEFKCPVMQLWMGLKYLQLICCKGRPYRR